MMQGGLLPVVVVVLHCTTRWCAAGAMSGSNVRQRDGGEQIRCLTPAPTVSQINIPHHLVCINAVI